MEMQGLNRATRSLLFRPHVLCAQIEHVPLAYGATLHLVSIERDKLQEARQLPSRRWEIRVPVGGQECKFSVMYVARDSVSSGYPVFQTHGAPLCTLPDDFLPCSITHCLFDNRIGFVTLPDGTEATREVRNVR